MQTRLLFLIILICHSSLAFAQRSNAKSVGIKERQYFVDALTRIARPVLVALSQQRLKASMPVEHHLANLDRANYTHLEVFGRLLTGMAPWLELGPDESPEGLLRKKYILLAREGIKNATDRNSKDFMNFNKGGQPLVDAAFLAQALLRAPRQLWEPLDQQVKDNLISALLSSRVIKPANNNWIMFSAMVEAALLKFTGKCDTNTINYALRMHMKWYKGDGVYGDGPQFHWDYYNSFVIQPMLLEVLQVLKDTGTPQVIDEDLIRKRAVRYAAIQERLISPEGTYPLIGRSATYRFGTFELLSKIALQHQLPPEIAARQVRAALYAVVKKQLEAPGTFDRNGWLQIGFYGHQPALGETYISTGSLYLCAQVFQILGLPATDDLWIGADVDWTARKIYKGRDISADHAID